MMKTRIVWTKIWEDAWFDGLSQEARILFIYLLTNNTIGLSGCYELRDKTICYHTHLSPDQLTKVKSELSPKVIFKENWIYIANAQGYNGFTGSSNEVALRKEIALIPQNIKDTLLKDKQYTPPTPSLQSINLNHNLNHNKKSEIRSKSYKLVGNTMVEE
jgi:hypothetical protein